MLRILRYRHPEQPPRMLELIYEDTCRIAESEPFVLDFCLIKPISCGLRIDTPGGKLGVSVLYLLIRTHYIKRKGSFNKHFI